MWKIVDTWHVTGLRGTGSHDHEVRDVFVPAHRACQLIDEPVSPGPLYTLPYVTIATILMASVALGIARHALDALEALASAKAPARSQTPLREHTYAQAQIGEAEGLLRAGQAFVYRTLEEAWDTAREGRRLTWSQHGLLRLASAISGRDRLRRHPRDKRIDTRIHLTARIVSVRERLAESEPQFLQRHTGGEALLDHELT
jgi:indole-3-acetate monooxygenase